MERLRMKRNSRGIATSISVMLLLVALLFFVSSIAHYSSMMSEADSRIAEAHVAGSRFDYAAYGAGRIAEEYGMAATVKGDRAAFGFNLTYSGPYRYAMQGWGRFIEFYGEREVSLDASDASLPKFVVRPQGMEAWHSQTGSEVEVDRGSAEVRHYNVTARLSSTNVELDDSQVVWAGSCENPGAIRLTVRAVGMDGGYAQIPYGVRCVDGSQESIVKIRAWGSELAALRIHGGGDLSYSYLAGSNAYLMIDAQLDSEPAYAVMGEGALTARSGGVEKTGGLYAG